MAGSEDQPQGLEDLSDVIQSLDASTRADLMGYFISVLSNIGDHSAAGPGAQVVACHFVAASESRLDMHTLRLIFALAWCRKRLLFEAAGCRKQ